MPFFKKADEMEMSINSRAMRLAWICGTAALFLWMVLDFFAGRDISRQLFIIMVQNAAFFGTKLYLTHKMTGNYGDSGEE